MPDGFDRRLASHPRGLSTDMAERLIVALDVSTIGEAERAIEALDGAVSFFKIGLWLAFANGIDGLISELINAKKKVFLDAKMFDIGQTVEEGVARAADRGVSFVTVHGDPPIIQRAVKGKRREIKIFSITVLTQLNDSALWDMGYRLGVKDLIRLRVRTAIDAGCDGVIASAEDDPDEIRQVAGSDKLLIATPGIRGDDELADDHARFTPAREAIARGADYLVVGRPIIKRDNPLLRANRMIEQMREGERIRLGLA